MATPTLALIPTGYKAGKLYSVLPESGVGDFTVVRATEATRVNEEGLIETMGANVPRLDYSGGGCPVLLTEGQRTNLLPYSSDFSNASWDTSRIETPYISGVVSPDGTLNAYTLEMSSGQTNGGGVFKTGISISGDNSFSVFAKKKTSKYLALGDTGLTSNAVYFDLENGVVGTTYNATGEIQDFGNGWYRCTMKYTLTSSNAKFIYQSNIDGTTLGGVVGGDSIYIYGAQLEAGSYPTSYIKTEGSAVTRNGDQVFGAGDASTFNDSEGVLMVDISALAAAPTRAITIGDGTNSNRIQFYYNSSNVLNGNVINVGSQVTGFSYSGDSNIPNKVALKYKVNDFSFWVNGFKIAVDTNGITPVGLNELQFNNGAGASPFYGKTKQVQYFNTALTDSELEKLTSWASFIEMAQAQNYNII